MAEQETINLGIVGISNKGQYNSETNYERLNVVTYNGSSYCALQSCKGIIPTNTDYWQLYAEKGETGETGPQGPAPIKGVDYYTPADKTEIKTDLSASIHQEVSEQVGSLVSVTPLAVSSISDMTDTTRIYVNTTDGNWYYYNGNSWVIGGLYQSTGISDEEVSIAKLNEVLKKNGLDTNYLEGAISYNIGSYSNQNGVCAPGSRSDRIRAGIPNVPGSYIQFFNPTGLIKLIYYICDDQDIILEEGVWSTAERKIFNNFMNGYRFRVALAYTDDRQITDENRIDLENSLSVMYYSKKIKGSLISRNSISLDSMSSLIPNENICDNVLYPVSVQASYVTGSETADNGSFICPVKPNTRYYVKVIGPHNRFYISESDASPYDIFQNNSHSNSMNINPYCSIRLIINDNTLDEYELVTSEIGKFLSVYVKHGGNSPSIVISENPIEDNKPFNPDFLGKKLFDNHVFVPEKSTSSNYFRDTEYASTHELQGCCTDGEYLYYGMHGAQDPDYDVIGKIDLETGDLALHVCDYDYHHINGMCYFPDNSEILIASMKPDGTIYRVDANTLSYKTEFSIKQQIENYWNLYTFGTFNGVGAIGYSDELEKFVLLIRENLNNHIWGFAITDKNFNIEKVIKLKNPSNSTSIRGGLDCDDKYIYMCIRENGTSGGECVYIYDYNGNIVNRWVVDTTGTIEGICKIDDFNYFISYASDTIKKVKVDWMKRVSLTDIYNRYNMNL